MVSVVVSDVPNAYSEPSYWQTTSAMFFAKYFLHERVLDRISGTMPTSNIHLNACTRVTRCSIAVVIASISDKRALWPVFLLLACREADTGILQHCQSGSGEDTTAFFLFDLC